MIIVSGRPFDFSELAAEYAQGSIEAELLTKLSKSEENYRYNSLDQLKFELKLRKATADAASALNNGRFAFAVFHKSKCNEAYWNRMENGGFRLKPGESPSAAINDIFTNGGKYATECATAMIIVYYKALIIVFGTRVFDKLFTDIVLMNWHSLDPLIKEVGMPVKVDEKLIGDRAYIKNPDVDPKTPEWQGENVIVLPGGLYYGHGIGITNAERIIRALNSNRKPGAKVSAYMLDAVSRPDYKKLHEAYRRNMPEQPAETARAWRAPYQDARRSVFGAI